MAIMFDTQLTAPVAPPAGVDARLYENSHDCIKIVNLDGIVIQLNPGGRAALELDEPNQLNGAAWRSLWPSESRDLVDTSLLTAREGRSARFAAFCPTQKGTERWWDVVVSPMFDAQDRVFQYVVVSRDVTDIHRAREALQEADRRKDEFLALLSHELRNPLSALAMAATALANGATEPARIAKLSGVISRQVDHMSRMAEDLLDISRVARGQIYLTLEPVEMRAAVNEAIEQVAAAVSAKQQALTVSVAGGATLVSADRTRLAQIIVNILANASRYTPAGGRIDVAIAGEAERVAVQIRDSGKGFPASLQATMFDLYTQGQAGGERSTGGLGLGLPIVKRLMELHGGQVLAHSDGEGAGSVFTLHFPPAGR